MRLWLRQREAIVDLLREILVIMAPQQTQQRWQKGAASVLYTYALVSHVYVSKSNSTELHEPLGDHIGCGYLNSITKMFTLELMILFLM